MYTISSPLPAFSERVFFSIIGRYTYITNKSGSKQGLFGRDVVRIVQYLQTLRKKEATFQDLFVALSLPDSAHEAIYSVFDALADKGFFQPPTTAIQYFGVDEQIFRIISAECKEAPTPLFANLELTTACNLRCVHCYNTDDHLFLPLEVVKAKLKELRQLGTLFVGLSGGEPLLHPHIKEIIDACDEQGIIVQLLTNATLLDNELVDLFCSKSVQVIKVSLYSLSEQQHNRITMRDSFRRTYDNIIRYKEQVAFSVSCPITRWNCDVIAPMKEWSKEQHIPVNFSLGIVAKSDCSKNNLETRMSFEQYKLCLAELDISPEQEVYPPENSRRLCSAGCSSIALDAHGDVLLCSLLKALKMNSAGETLYETWFHSHDLKRIRAMTRNDLQRCVDCRHQHQCHICLADNYNETGDLLCVPEEVCLQRKVKFSL